jgi:hypothetical protein
MALREAVGPGRVRKALKNQVQDPENGVDDGTRTHDSRDHNPGLYQLSYAHH